MLLNFGVARLAAIVYFIQGSLGIAGVALPLYLRAQGFSITKITFITSVSAIPWFFKIVYGAVSDAVPIFGLRRKPYLIICSLLSCTGWTLLSFLPPIERCLIGSMFVANIGFAATDVITDGLVVEYSRNESAQTYQAISWGFRSLGAVFSGFIGGILAARFEAQTVFLITGMLPLISLAAILLLREKPWTGSIDHGSIIAPIIKSVKIIIFGDLKWFILLLMILSNSAAIGTPLFFYMREILNFDEIFLGVLNSITWLGGTIGCLLFINFFRKMRLQKALYWAVGVGFVNVLLTLAIKSHSTAFAISLVLGVLGYMVLLPLFSAAAKLAHGTDVESSLFAIVMSFFNIGQAVASVWGGFLYEKIGLPSLIIFASFLGLFAFLVIPLFKKL